MVQAAVLLCAGVKQQAGSRLTLRVPAEAGQPHPELYSTPSLPVVQEGLGLKKVVRSCCSICDIFGVPNPKICCRQEYLGLKKVIWFWRGICGDDAVVNGHVDNFCCFAEPGKVMLAWTDDEMDPQVRRCSLALHMSFYSPVHLDCSSWMYQGLVHLSTGLVPVQWEVSNRALDVLKNTTDAKGRKIEVCKIRLPPPQFRNYREAEGLAVSHADIITCSDDTQGSPCYILHRVSSPVPCSCHLITSVCSLSHLQLCCGGRQLAGIKALGVPGLQPDHIEKGYVPRIAGERLPATYINHYTANGALRCLHSTLQLSSHRVSAEGS